MSQNSNTSHLIWSLVSGGDTVEKREAVMQILRKAMAVTDGADGFQMGNHITTRDCELLRGCNGDLMEAAHTRQRELAGDRLSDARVEKTGPCSGGFCGVRRGPRRGVAKHILLEESTFTEVKELTNALAREGIPINTNPHFKESGGPIKMGQILQEICPHTRTEVDKLHRTRGIKNVH